MIKEFIRKLLLKLNISYFVGSADALPPPLDKEKELEYLIKSKQGDVEARNKLIEHNLRLVVFLAKKYENTGFDIEDLVSIGSIGLIKGINTYKIDKNIKLATYASRCIANEILMFLRKNKKRKSEVSFEDALNFDSEGNELHLEDILGTAEDLVSKEFETNMNKTELCKEINSLNARDKEIMVLRYGLNNTEEYTQKEVALMLGISQSYISRIEKKVIKKLKSTLKAWYNNSGDTMKKKLIIVIGIIVLLYIGLVVIDLKRVDTHEKPLLTLKTKAYKYADGKAYEYISLGYKYVKYEREWLNDKEMLFITSDLQDNSQYDFDISVISSDKCNEEPELYISSYRNYYINCLDNIYVNFKDGENKELKDAFSKNMITLNSVLNKTSKITRIKDSTSVIYEFKDFDILVCHETINNVTNDIVIAPKLTKDDAIKICGDSYFVGTITEIGETTFTVIKNSSKEEIIINKENLGVFQLNDKIKVYYIGNILDGTNLDEQLYIEKLS